MNDLLALYEEVVLDHNRHPRHFGELLEATHQAEGHNPFCGNGDHIKLYITLVEQTIKAIQFTGLACTVCMASASMLTEFLHDKSILRAQDSFAAFLQLVEHGTLTDESSLGKLKVFACLQRFPQYAKCAALPWHALKAALIKES